MGAQLGVYRPRHPEHTPFYRCLDDYWEEFERGYEVLFEKVYGPLRAAVTDAASEAEPDNLTALESERRLISPIRFAKRLRQWFASVDGSRLRPAAAGSQTT